MKPTLLLVSQVYIPDPAAVGQHMADVANAMATRGWRVVVLTADRGYDDPKEKFSSTYSNGILIKRLPFSSLGKKTILHRLGGQLLFCGQAFLHGLFVRGLNTVLVSTSPPMGSIVGWAIRSLRRVKVAFWVMDINPDQTVRLGVAPPKALTVKLLIWLNQRILKTATTIVVLDKYMHQTMAAKRPSASPRIKVLPPWALEGVLSQVEHFDNPFRQRHQLENMLVFMYSGNHSLAHPLDTFLEVARKVEDLKNIVFLFVGGGNGKKKVDDLVAAGRPNIRSLPYQPLEQIRYSLSAADVHLVSMGPEMVGVVHPCKVYGAMALSKPIIYLGPKESHVGDILGNHDCGWQVDHGDVTKLESLIRKIHLNPHVLEPKGLVGERAIRGFYSKENLLDEFLQCLEEVPRIPEPRG